MRILAIRGCNLASLAGEFEIDLEHGPLGAAGVFAIVGNTGAGKSTLLDALCVALFDRTPRLTNHSRVIVGRDDDDPGALGAQDVRTLLRRGAASGWAEVDFESGDGRRYRAKWSVRRARGQTDGTIQPQQVALTALDGGERLGGTKTETLEAIHDRLGLSFDQFRRSALLAQGEFAAFLRADGKDRSELLERMTGTEIYSRLSVQAHLRAAIADQALTSGRIAAHAIPVLEDEARRATEIELATAEQTKLAVRKRHAAAETAARWVAEAARRDIALAGSTEAFVLAEAAVTAAQAERAELALRRRAETLRGPWDDAARLDTELAIARSHVSAAGAASVSAAAAYAMITEHRSRVGELHAPIRAARIAAGLVERGLGSLEQRAIATAVAAEALGRATLDDAGWLEARSVLAPEVATWSELEARFVRHAQLGEAITALDRSLTEHAGSHDKLALVRTDLVTQHQAAVAKHGDAQRKADSFQKRRGLTLDAARRHEDEARARLSEIERLVAIAAGARSAAAARDEMDRRIAELAADATLETDQRGHAESARATALVLRDERTRVVEELRKAAGYEHARAELVDGDPCPLCGAPEHPWRDRGAFDDVIAAATARLGETVAELDAATATLASLTARAQQRTVELARLAKTRATTVATVADAVGTWSGQLTALGELSLVGDPATAAAEALGLELHAAAKKKLEEARTTRSQTEAATKAAADAQADVQLCQANVDQLAARLADVDRQVGELAATIKGIQAERETRIERHQELAAQIEAAIARWTAGRDGLATPATTERTGAKAPTRVPSTRTAATRRGASAIETARAWIAELVTEWRARSERIAAAEAALAAALVAIDHDARDAERAVAAHHSRLAECERRQVELHIALGEAVERLDLARAGSGFDIEELRALLSADPSRVEILVQQLAALDRSVDTARAVVTERRRLVDDHALSRPASIEDAAHIETIAATLTQAEDHVARLATTLAADDEARARRIAALAQLASAEDAADVDRILGEVIGSHDGKLFRSFAQSLTLDGLLAVANSHLEELAPRYRLERVPKHDLELQVIDRDLGHEVRSVQSLSGGESFLVSLALALGLSSMSAHDVRVRTLLIDEGFGTLDPATLDSALSVLDALQARGRQVGVISHVPALVERVGAHVRVVQRGGGRSEVIVA
ncbi:MAG: sbcC [Myxococcales bacterium]|nr:sbcC [Myxococcales bacterium]